MDDNKMLRSGRFQGSSSDITEKISSSIHFDFRLYRQDIRGSIAHAKMIAGMGILTAVELKSIVDGLKEIEKEIESGSFEFLSSLEDIHMNIESRLTDKIGDAGRKLHTGRSRNDQIATDMRLYIRDESSEIHALLKSLIEIIITKAEQNIDAIMPGYTHMQVAQPVRFSHHILAYAWQFYRDSIRLKHSVESCMSLPLGSGALAGVNYPSDREYVRETLGFTDIIHNSMDAVSDRDFILDFLYFGAVLGTHLSRFCEELVLWSTSEFNYILLSDKVTTGSSIMPQKRNPDVAELVRGKSGRLYGNLFAMLTILKGLPMTYNRDLQEDKEPLFDSIDTVRICLSGMIEMISEMEIKTEVMKKAVYRNFSTATDLADYLAKKGLPFRKSHEISGKIVKYCEETDTDFFSIDINTLKAFSDVFQDDIADSINPENSTERKLSPGSTSKTEILKQISELKKLL
jgi:argininosuccinate lyase